MASSSRLRPGERGKVKVTVDIRGRIGSVTKTIAVHTNDPLTPVATLTVRLSIKTQIHMAAYQASEIFTDKCKECHVDLGKGKRGWDLFKADCFMCHNAGKSASLTEMGKRPKAHLRKAIREGVENTVMPGWDERHGGPLDDGDIDSLVDLISP